MGEDEIYLSIDVLNYFLNDLGQRIRKHFAVIPGFLAKEADNSTIETSSLDLLKAVSDCITFLGSESIPNIVKFVKNNQSDSNILQVKLFAFKC